MTKREIASLAIKLMGVFILLKSIAYVAMALGGFFSVMRSDHMSILLTLLYFVMIVISVMVPLVFSILVIKFSDKAAARLIQDDQAMDISNVSINKDDVMLVVISCIGLYFIIAAAPVLINALLINSVMMNGRGGIPYVGPSGMLHILRNLVVPVVQIGLGIWLFAGSKGIVKLWKKIRS